MYCSCQNLLGKKFNVEFHRVKTDDEGRCELCGYYATHTKGDYVNSTPEIKNSRGVLGTLVGSTSLVSNWHLEGK